METRRLHALPCKEAVHRFAMDAQDAAENARPYAARMNAVAIFVGLLFWGWVWNVWGLLLAVPMLMVIKAVCDHVDDLNPVGELLGE